jgi:hypothetical protein
VARRGFARANLGLYGVFLWMAAGVAASVTRMWWMRRLLRHLRVAFADPIATPAAAPSSARSSPLSSSGCGQRPTSAVGPW